MERLANALMCSVARGLGLPERFFDRSFERGLSTLRLDPLSGARGPDAGGQHAATALGHARGQAPLSDGNPHVDSGFLTLAGAGRG
jgi:isopenicillin N synthase-like dioxygenase